jgi:hypothetical protein
MGANHIQLLLSRRVGSSSGSTRIARLCWRRMSFVDGSPPVAPSPSVPRGRYQAGPVRVRRCAPLTGTIPAFSPVRRGALAPGPGRRALRGYAAEGSAAHSARRLHARAVRCRFWHARAGAARAAPTVVLPSDAGSMHAIARPAGGGLLNGRPSLAAWARLNERTAAPRLRHPAARPRQCIRSHAAVPSEPGLCAAAWAYRAWQRLVLRLTTERSSRAVSFFTAVGVPQHTH